MATQKGIDTWKTKRWFSVYAPKVFNDALIAEIPANDDKAVMNRRVKVSLDYLTHNPQNSYVNLFFRVTAVNGDKAETQLVRSEVLFSYLRSMVRRYRSVTESVVTAKSKDSREITIKPIIVTAQRSTHSRMIGIRKEANLFLEDYIKQNETDSIIRAVVEGKLQQEMYAKLDHITPLNKVEIKKLEIAQ